MADPVWAVEERLWLEGSDAFEAVLDPGCVMAFPGMGILRRDAVLAGLRGAPRWGSVEMTDKAASRIGEGLIVLGYAAEARRDGAPPYRCLCTSTWRAAGDGWRLVQHQQTPVE